MKFTVLGSGASVPHPRRTSSAYWLETQKGSLLIDCSASAIFRIAQENLNWANLDSVWISHFHLDHFGGLAPLLFSLKYAPETQSRLKPMRIFGPVGLKSLLEKINSANNYGLFEQPFPLEIVEVEPMSEFYPLEDARAIALKTPHTSESLAISITDSENKKFTFTSDTGFNMEIGAFAYEADLFVLECSFVKSKPVEIHLELTEAMHLVRYAKPQRAMLTHFYPEWDSLNFHETIELFSPNCEVIQARDGLRLEI